MPVTILMATVTGMGASVEVPPAIVYVVGSLLTVVGLTIGRVRDLNGQLGDETVRRQAEVARLERSEHRFRTLLEHEFDGIAVVQERNDRLREPGHVPHVRLKRRTSSSAWPCRSFSPPMTKWVSSRTFTTSC